jgi:hypothetical protein
MNQEKHVINFFLKKIIYLFLLKLFIDFKLIFIIDFKLFFLQIYINIRVACMHVIDQLMAVIRITKAMLRVIV